MKDLKFYDGYEKVMEDRRLYQDCPAKADRLFADLFVVDGSGAKDISKKIVPGLIEGLEKYNTESRGRQNNEKERIKNNHRR